MRIVQRSMFSTVMAVFAAQSFFWTGIQIGGGPAWLLFLIGVIAGAATFRASWKMDSAVYAVSQAAKKLGRITERLT